MENIKLLEKSIIEKNAHQHICLNDEHEKNYIIEKFLKDYNIILNDTKPIAIKLEDFLLPEMEIDASLDSKLINVLSREHLYFAIIYQILKNIKEKFGDFVTTDLGNGFLKVINKVVVKDSSKQIKSINELLHALEESRYAYYEQYQEYLQNGTINLNKEHLTIPYAKDLQFWLYFIKKIINTEYYFAMLINIDENITKITESAINGIVAMPITSDLSVKLFLDSEEDFVDYDLSNHSVTNYEIVNLERKAKLVRTK